jgi:hypothetical protein
MRALRTFVRLLKCLLVTPPRDRFGCFTGVRREHIGAWLKRTWLYEFLPYFR